MEDSWKLWYLGVAPILAASVWLGRFLAEEYIGHTPQVGSNTIRGALVTLLMAVLVFYGVYLVPVVNIARPFTIGSWIVGSFNILLGSLLAAHLLRHSKLDASQAGPRWAVMQALAAASCIIGFGADGGQQRAKVYNQVGDYELYRPARVLAMSLSETDDNGNGQLATLTVEWSCFHDSLFCRTSLVSDCGLNGGYAVDDDWMQGFYRDVVQIAVYNVANNENCEALAEEINESSGDRYNSSTLSPVNDGSPYVWVFCNCTHSCSALGANRQLNGQMQQAHAADIGCVVSALWMVAAGALAVGWYRRTRRVPAVSAAELLADNKPGEDARPEIL